GDGRITTDQEGRFEVAGLSAREYTIVGFDTERFVAVQSGPIAAGTRDLVLREPANDCHESVRGVVLSHTGHPVRGVKLSVDLQLMFSNKTVSSPDLLTTRTHSDGRFEFARVPKHLAS